VINCVSPEDGPKGLKHVVNKEKNNINKFSVAIAGTCLKNNIRGYWLFYSQFVSSHCVTVTGEITA
jgi:hypothetical protein